MPSAQSTIARPQIRQWSWALAGQAAQVLGQAGSFLLIAKALPVSDMGFFIAATSLTSILAPFTGMGAANLLIKQVARNRSAFASLWANLLGTTLASGCVLCLAAIPACWLLLSGAVPFYAIVLLVVADLMLWRWLYLVGLTLQGLGEIDRKSQLEILVVCVRLTAAMLLFLLPKSQHQVRTWLLIYFGAALLAASCCLAWSLRRWGKPGNLRLPALSELKEGLWFVASPSTQTINNDADKLLLARLASLSAAGIYGAAYRVISASFLPVQALLTLTYPRFFRHGGRGLRQSTRFAIRWLPFGLGYSIAVGILLFAGAPLIVKILGPGYVQTATVIRQLSVLPMMKTFQYFLADALTGADYQTLRVGLQGSVALINVVLNLLWIPQLGWEGAVRTTLFCDGGLALLLMVAVLVLLNRAGHGPRDIDSAAALR
jgi:O-antigen/teichoic acid export membrane protein